MRGEDEEPTNPSTIKKKVEKPQAEEEPAEDLPWHKKYREYMIGAAVMGIFFIIIIIIFAVGGGGDDNDSDKSQTVPTEAPTARLAPGATLAPTNQDGETAPPGSTFAPTTFFEFLDKDGDGLAEFECDAEPYFDNAGRLIIAGCAST